QTVRDLFEIAPSLNADEQRVPVGNRGEKQVRVVAEVVRAVPAGRVGIVRLPSRLQVIALDRADALAERAARRQGERGDAERREFHTMAPPPSTISPSYATAIWPGEIARTGLSKRTA